MNIDDIRQLLQESAGVDESVDIDGDIGRVEFGALGYDSLAVLELAARVEQQYGVKIREEEVAELTTPGSFVDYVNNARAVASS